MKRKTLFKGLYILGFTLFILVSTLVIHIYMVTNSKNDDHRNRQLSRIDFKQELDSTQANAVKHFVLGLSGVDAAYFNLEDKTFVYSYNPEIQHSDLVFNALMKKFPIHAEKFKVDETLASNGCPVIDKSTFTYKVGSLVQNIIN